MFSTSSSAQNLLHDGSHQFQSFNGTLSGLAPRRIAPTTTSKGIQLQTRAAAAQSWAQKYPPQKPARKMYAQLSKAEVSPEDRASRARAVMESLRMADGSAPAPKQMSPPDAQALERTLSNLLRAEGADGVFVDPKADAKAKTEAINEKALSIIQNALQGAGGLPPSPADTFAARAAPKPASRMSPTLLASIQLVLKNAEDAATPGFPDAAPFVPDASKRVDWEKISALLPPSKAKVPGAPHCPDEADLERIRAAIAAIQAKGGPEYVHPEPKLSSSAPSEAALEKVKSLL